jgi:uncharacterized protein (DUF302 family)
VEGFGVLTEMRFKSVLKKKETGSGFYNYTILELQSASIQKNILAEDKIGHAL